MTKLMTNYDNTERARSVRLRERNSHSFAPLDGKCETKFNSLKLRVLRAFDDRGWLSPGAVAVLLGLRPRRWAWSYLKRLHEFGLLQRRRRRGLLVYRLSERGRARLAWLSARMAL